MIQMATGYAYQEYDEVKMARVYGRGLSVSFKKSVEVCNLLRGKNLNTMREKLKNVVSLKEPVQYRRFNQELAHQTSVGSGGFPVKVCKAVIRLLDSVESNANDKDLNTDSLKIVHACAHQGSRPMRGGRKGRVKAKRTHIEIVVKESKPEKKAAASKAKKGESPKGEGSGKTEASKSEDVQKSKGIKENGGSSKSAPKDVAEEPKKKSESTDKEKNSSKKNPKSTDSKDDNKQDKKDDAQ